MLLYVLGILIALGYASELWRRRRAGAGWQRELNFVVDLLAMSAVILVVGVLVIMQLTNDPAAAQLPPTPGAEVASNVNPDPGGLTTSADEMVPDPTIAGEGADDDLPPQVEDDATPAADGEATPAPEEPDAEPSPDDGDEPEATATRRPTTGPTRTPRATASGAGVPRQFPVRRLRARLQRPVRRRQRGPRPPRARPLLLRKPLRLNQPRPKPLRQPLRRRQPPYPRHRHPHRPPPCRPPRAVRIRLWQAITCWQFQCATM